MFLWELASLGKKPLKTLERFDFFSKIKYITEKNYCDEIPEDTPLAFAKLINMCLDQDSSKRPPIQVILQMLAQIKLVAFSKINFEDESVTHAFTPRFK